MKKRNLLISLSAIAALALSVVIYSSCKGPKGDAGPDGNDGLNGIDANSFCKTCHTVANWSNKQSELDSSGHVAGGSMTPGTGRGMRRDCAMCHSREGYEETLKTGLDTTVANHYSSGQWYTNYYENHPIECHTCHTFHGTLTESEFPNYALRNVGPYKLRFDHTTVNDLGASNTCGRCHQVRTQTDTTMAKPVMAYTSLSATTMVDIRSGSFGVHDSPVSNVFGAKGFYPLRATAYTNDAHSANGVQCGDCHVLSTVAADRSMGGHTFKLESEAGVQNVTQCNKCHTGVTTLDRNGVQTEIKGMLVQIEDALEAKGYYHTATTPSSLSLDYGGNSDFKLYNATSGTQTVNAANPLNRSERFAAAIFDFKMIVVEHSYGIHNYTFTKELLTDVLAEINAAPNNN